MERVRSRYRAALAVQARLEGKPYDLIAYELGFANRSGAWKAVDRCLSRFEHKVASQFIDEMIIDLELLQSRSWKSAMAGDSRAIDRCQKALDKRVRLVERRTQLIEVS